MPLDSQRMAPYEIKSVCRSPFSSMLYFVPEDVEEDLSDCLCNRLCGVCDYRREKKNI